MANEKVLQNFNNLYDQVYAKFKPSYTPQSASALKDSLSRTMRPAYDKQITQRQQAAAANRAAIDADAGARGMGSSTWVTDVKNRQRDAEAKDIAGINSDYNAALYSALLNRLNAQDEMSMSAENAAIGHALGVTNSLFPEYNKATSSGGGGGGWGRRGSTSGDNGDDGNGTYQDALNALKKQGYTTRSAVDYLQKGTDLQKVGNTVANQKIKNPRVITPTKKYGGGSTTRVGTYK